MAPLRRSLLLPLTFVLAFGASAAPRPKQVVSRVDAGDDRGVVITLEAPAPVWTPGGGYVYPSVDGFGLLGETGRPALPTRILRVGIPPGAQPRLEILDSRTVPGKAGLVGPVQSWTPLLPGSETLVPFSGEDAAVYGADALYPAETPVRLGAVGSFREQQFVEIIFTPVLHNPARRTSTVTSSVTVRIDFGAIEPGAAAIAHSEGGDDPSYETIYEHALVNATQARRFRGVRRAEGQLPSDLSRAGASTLTPVSARYKMVINKNGVYRLSASWATTNAPDLLNRPVANLRVDCLGVQVPITVVDANTDGAFNGTDVIELYGQALTWDILSPDGWNGGDFTDDNVYWIYADSAAGVRATSRASAPTDTLTIPVDFSETTHHEINSRFVQQVPDDPIDHWAEDVLVASGTPGNPGPNASKTFSVATPGVSSGPGATTTASIKVRLMGEFYENNFHRSQVQVNTQPSPVSGPSDWGPIPGNLVPTDPWRAGFREFTHGVDDGPATFSQSLLVDGNPETTNVTVSLPLGRCTGVNCPGSPAVTYDQVDQNWIEITYGRQFKAGTDDVLVFSVPNANAQIKVTGLPTNQTAIYEITKTLTGSPVASPVRVTGQRIGGAGPFQVEFEVLNNGAFPPTRRFIVAAITGSGTTGDLLPASVRARAATNLRTPATGADWLVVYNATLVDTSSTAWNNLKARRQSQGLRAVTVDVEDVYDEFSYGIIDPEGIRDFFAWVYANWPRIDPNVPLRYGILVGDASIDPKNYYGYAQNKNLMPTYLRSVKESTILGYMMDESYFENVVSGQVEAPDFALGRWPSHSIAETNTIADKIVTYETQSVSPPRPPWQYDNVFIADDDETVFETVQENQIAQYLSNTPEFMNGAYGKHRTYERQIPGLPSSQKADEMRDRIIRQLNGTVTEPPPRDIGPGASVITYVGHGSWQDWGSNFSFFHVASSGSDDLATVTNATKLPLIVIADCISGGFAAVGPTNGIDLTSVFAEAFLTRSGKGAIGVIAPSHLTTTNAHDTALGKFFELTYGRTKIREIGLFNLGIQLAFSSNDVVNTRSYTLFGDPALKLVVPLPGKTSSVTPTPGNQQVTLNWSAVPGASSYNVYISSNPTGPYARVNPAVIAGTSYTATNLTNCTPYYFNVTALESNLFEGSYSHATCGLNGGPCVTSTPRQATAPNAPSGVTATDNETGGAIRINWNASSPAEEVVEHKVYWGTQQNVYTNSQSAGPAASWLVTGLTNGTPYYFAVSASNCSQGEGPKGVAPPVVPRQIEGIKPPNEIDNLMVLRSPDPGDHIDDIRLQWTPPTTNVYGQPTTLSFQEVYRGTTPTFAAIPGNRIATVTGTANFYIHEDAFAGTTKYYYHIVATDTSGNRSGISRELPMGINALTVARSGSNLQFNWPAVTLDVDGRHTLVSKYVLYGQANPFRRSQIATVPIVRDNLTSTTVTIPKPGGLGLFCYSVIAVDNKGAQSPW